jgi:hypothetical protein
VALGSYREISTFNWCTTENKGMLTLNIGKDKCIIRVAIGKMLKCVDGSSLLVRVTRMVKGSGILPQLNIAPLLLKKPGYRRYNGSVSFELILLCVWKTSIVGRLDARGRGRRERISQPINTLASEDEVGNFKFYRNAKSAMQIGTD